MCVLMKCYRCQTIFPPYLNAHLSKKESELILFIVSHGMSMPDAMKSFQNGFLATVVTGNQHSLQTAHRALQREREIHREWQHGGELTAVNLVFVCQALLIQTHHLHSCVTITHTGSWKAFSYSEEVCGFAVLPWWLLLQAKTLTEMWPISIFLTHAVHSNTCPKHGQKLSIAGTRSDALFTCNQTLPSTEETLIKHAGSSYIQIKCALFIKRGWKLSIRLVSDDTSNSKLFEKVYYC